MSLDLSTPSVLRNRERGGGEKTAVDPLATARPSRDAPLSPTLPPMVFVGWVPSTIMRRADIKNILNNQVVQKSIWTTTTCSAADKYLPSVRPTASTLWYCTSPSNYLFCFVSRNPPAVPLQCPARWAV